MTDEQRALRDTVRLLLSRMSGSDAVRAAVASRAGYDAALWSRLCGEVGVAGLAIPERYGGHGATLAETGIVLAELGRTLTPAPLLGSAVLAAQTVLATGDADHCARLLPGIAVGTTIAALVWVGGSGRWDPTDAACSATRPKICLQDRASIPKIGLQDRASTRSDMDWTLTGDAHYVLDGDIADVLIVVAHAGDGLAVFEVDPTQPGVARTHTPAMDLTRRLATVRLTDAVGRRLGTGQAGPALARVRDITCAALSAEQVGAARRCLELTVEYTMSRVQFGRPIGGFQALKHRMADLYVLVETAESASAAAMTAVADDLPVAAAVAKTYCSEAFCSVAGEMIQLHGGIAITWEHDAHLYFKRAHGSAQLFGQPRQHVARLAEMP